ncbi:hypothetical protein B0H14DRAFT_3431472 [Mycena olivaceomarginata]|nr:hypothetical protein B0H14DRAFT_3431472 [Mycena olivaceomarginata]
MPPPSIDGVDNTGTVHNFPPLRRGRSSTYCFKNQRYGQPIQSLRPTDFKLALCDELHRVLGREETDLVYRGEIPPNESCVPSNAGTPLESDDDLPQSDRAVTSSPEPRARH